MTPFVRAGIVVLFAFIVFANLSWAGPARPYYYDRVVDENGPLYFTFRPEISDNGRVVFKAWEQGQSGEALYTGPNPVADAFVRVPHPEFHTLRGYTINDAGTVAFTAQFGGSQTTASTGSAFDGPSLANNLIPNMPETLAGVGSVSLNNSRQVVIGASYKDGTVAVRGVVIAATGGNGRVVARATNSNGPYKSFGIVQITNAGTVVFSSERWFASHPGPALEYTRVEGGPVIGPEWDTQPRTAGFFAMNDVGTIAFNGTRLDGISIIDGIAVGSIEGGAAPFVANDRGALYEFRDVGLNNSGTVAFYALRRNDLGGGIFTGPDPMRDRVIADHDPLFGGMVQDVYFQRDGLNNLGQVAFGFQLENGAGGGIAVATPAMMGDANLDRAVTLDDFNALAAHFGQSGMTWNEGDFTGDGVVNLDDFNALAGHFGQAAGATGPSAHDWADLGAAVPEPAGCALFVAAVCATASRRARRRV